MSLLEIKDLKVRYITSYATVEAVNGISFTLEKGECLGLVGETGAGKSTTAYSILGLLPVPPAKITSGEILFEGQDLLQLSDKQMREIRGDDITMIFQDPMTALNPIQTVGDQVAEVIQLHQDCSWKEAREKAGDIFEKVGIQRDRAKDFPHQFSGGMKQRVVIAIALACQPKLLLADEPTTALDVTIQAQVIKMMKELREENDMSMIFITHDMGIVAEVCDKVAVMYAGEIVELGTLPDIFHNRKHPYTKGLFDSIPSLANDVEWLKPINGLIPDPANLPKGCKFNPRCPFATEQCKETEPDAIMLSDTHMVKCHLCKGGAENA